MSRKGVRPVNSGILARERARPSSARKSVYAQLAHFAERVPGIVNGVRYFTVDPFKHRIGLLSLIDRAKHETGAGNSFRVLELASGSGRLANVLLKKGEVLPQNYVLGDSAYAQGVTVKRGVIRNLRNGTKLLPLSVKERPAGDIGKFHLIMVPFYSGEAITLNSLLDNYFVHLAPQGLMVVNRACFTHMNLERLLVEGKKLSVPNQQSELEEFLQRLIKLRDDGKVRFSDFDELFHKSVGTNGKDIFIIQKIKD
jgi:hypothetical protein